MISYIVQQKKGCGKSLISPLPKEEWDKCGDMLDGKIVLCNKCSKNVHKAKEVENAN